jgi:hypothetical protein
VSITINEESIFDSIFDSCNVSVAISILSLSPVTSFCLDLSWVSLQETSPSIMDMISKYFIFNYAQRLGYAPLRLVKDKIYFEVRTCEFE